ncbi:MAG: C39 family peptidase [Candidatus Sericytochromatia bacterium]|nr:C39 family peptidase [Candidatus Sericytochromatia bacterium]
MPTVPSFGGGFVPVALVPVGPGPIPPSSSPWAPVLPVAQDAWIGHAPSSWQPAVTTVFAPAPYADLLAQLDTLVSNPIPSPPVLAPMPGAPMPVSPPPVQKQPAPPPLPRTTPRGIPANPESWFISQNRGVFNSREDAPGNGNCGPTSLTMIARAFGKVEVTPESANAAIEETRRRMGAGTRQSDEFKGTSFKQLEKGAASYGLNTRVVWGGLDKLRAELAQGRLVIAHVCATYLRPGTRTGHYAVVWKVEGNKVYLNDPANRKGPIVITTAQFLAAQKARGTHGLISIGA